MLGWQSMRAWPKSLPIGFIVSTIVIIFAEILQPQPIAAQTATGNQNTTIGESSDSNQINQNNQQVPVFNSNVNNVRLPRYPVNTPGNAAINTENDFGFNLSTAVNNNARNSANFTVFFGVVYQPGRTNDHRARMARLKQETELLGANRRILEANLLLLQTQIQEAQLRLRQLEQATPAPQPPKLPRSPDRSSREENSPVVNRSVKRFQTLNVIKRSVIRRPGEVSQMTKRKVNRVDQVGQKVGQKHRVAGKMNARSRKVHPAASR